MLSDDTKVKVRNLTSHYVIYRDDDKHLRVQFQPNQVREIDAGGLRKFFYRYGGQVILQNYLSVENDELRKEFDIDPEQVEYDWDAAKIKSVLLEEPIEVLEDAMEFGPDGIKEELATQAVNLSLPDNNKRKVISSALGINITEKINLKEEAGISSPSTDDADKPKRRRRVTQTSK